MTTDVLLLLALLVVSGLRVFVYQAHNREIDKRRMRRPVGGIQGQRKGALPPLGRVPARQSGVNTLARKHS
jgi:hypothetical protein